ncbi:hypothetical protein DYD21_16695 [Rhodohalobacter sp. SW132]|uniref:hypothetical protein n=1 Tax=Rhodohalobacter sp. SW132 TaxID=2293433 RepID=UPI000E25AD1F|nr:hypothetical protein [Rhodohalobacter sp. SW132]REL24799.1 hypothetical protein DYD21_16695 [Rhodohalobacter sp. SW132]
MNIGITISYIVGGLLLISILTLNNTVMQDSYKQTVEMTAGTQVDEIRRLVMHDMQFLAFGTNSEILNFSENHLRFRSTFRGQNRVFSWQLLNAPYNETSNPNDRVLQRNGPMDDKPGSTMSRYPAVRFQVTAFSDEDGLVEATSKEQVRSILIEVIVESAEPVGSHTDGSPRYARTGWKKLFLPDNLMI